MSWQVSFLSVFVVCVAVMLAKPVVGLTMDELVEMIDYFSEKKEKYEFIRNYYLEGYQLYYNATTQHEVLDDEAKFSLDVFTLLCVNLTRNATEDVQLLTAREPVCFPLPIGCIDSGDSGIRPT